MPRRRDRACFCTPNTVPGAPSRGCHDCDIRPILYMFTASVPALTNIIVLVAERYNHNWRGSMLCGSHNAAHQYAPHALFHETTHTLQTNKALLVLANSVITQRGHTVICPRPAAATSTLAKPLETPPPPSIRHHVMKPEVCGNVSTNSHQPLVSPSPQQLKQCHPSMPAGAHPSLMS
jgi:hypothetical protein